MTGDFYPDFSATGRCQQPLVVAGSRRQVYNSIMMKQVVEKAFPLLCVGALRCVDNAVADSLGVLSVKNAGEGEPGAPDRQGDLAVEEARPKLKPPRLYKVVMLNDDYTPMDFVVEVLEVIFRLGREDATRVMLTVHTQGKAVCGVYPRDIAETKADQVMDYARENQHPLMCQVEPA